MANGAESPASLSLERITGALRVHPNPGVSNTPGKGYSCKSYTHSQAPSHSTQEEISDPDRYRPDHCPQCGAKQPLTGHGFYCRTLVDLAFDGVIRVRRYLCRICKRTVSLLPEFALPWLRLCAPWTRRQTSSPEPCGSSNPSGGSLRIVSCFRSFVFICWAGLRVSFRQGGEPRWPPRAPLPDAPYTAFAWRKIAAPDYRPGHGGFPHGCQIRETGPFSLRANRAAGDRTSSPRRTHAPRPGDRRPQLRHPPFETDGGFHRYAAGLGAALPQRRFRSAGSQTSPGPWSVSRHQPATGQSHRTPQAREPAPHRHDFAARTGLVFRSGHTRALRVHALPFPQTTRPLGKATARPTSAQEV